MRKKDELNTADQNPLKINEPNPFVGSKNFGQLCTEIIRLTKAPTIISAKLAANRLNCVLSLRIKDWMLKQTQNKYVIILGIRRGQRRAATKIKWRRMLLNLSSHCCQTIK